MKVLYVIPVEEIQQNVAKCIYYEQHFNDNPNALHFWLSLSQHLKDVKRWQYAKTHQLPKLSPAELEKYVDEMVNK